MHNVNANGAAIPAIGLGTSTLKGEKCAELVHEALRLGYRHIDTAAMYGNEEAVGEALRSANVPREELFITTKVQPQDIAPGDLERSAEESLRRLGLDRVDLLLIHWPNAKIPLEGSIASLNGAHKDGMTSHIGVSNFTTKLIPEAVKYSDAPLVANEVEYHPYLNQDKVLDACRDNGLAMISYCPLAQGGGVIGEAAITEAAHAHGKTPGQIVLRWHVQQEGVVAIPRTSKKARLAENIGIFDFELSEEEMERIHALTARNERLIQHSYSPQWDTP